MEYLLKLAAWSYLLSFSSYMTFVILILSAKEKKIDKITLSGDSYIITTFFLILSILILIF